MSLSGFARLVSGLVACLALIGAAWLALPTLSEEWRAGNTRTGSAVALRNRALIYRLDTEQPTQFVFSQPSTITRILSTAAIDPQDWEARAKWVYGYRVALLDDAGAVIATHDLYSSASNPAKLEEPIDLVRFVRGDATRIGTQDQAVISSSRPFVAMAITALPSDSGVRQIDVRAYEQRPVLGPSAGMAAYRRRSDAERVEMMRANAFPEPFVSDSERVSTIVNQWRPLGPSGISGRDYRVSVMYQGTRGAMAGDAASGDLADGEDVE